MYKNAKSIDRGEMFNQISQWLGRTPTLNEQDENPVFTPQKPSISQSETKDNEIESISNEPILLDVAKGIGNATKTLRTDKYSPQCSVGNNTKNRLCDIHTADHWLSLTNIPQNQSPPSATKFNLRSVKQINEERCKIYPNHRFQVGMPIGPWPDLQTAIERLGEWAEKVVGFKIKRGGGKHASKRRGITKQLLCDRSGTLSRKLSTYDTDGAERRNTKTKKCNCPWELWIEESDVGWIPMKMSEKCFSTNDFHGGTHTLMNSTTEMLSNASCRNIPEHLIETANILFDARIYPSKIYTRLFEICREEKIEVTFIQKDVANLFKGKSVDHALDCTNLIQHLRSRESKDPSIECKFLS